MTGSLSRIAVALMLSPPACLTLCEPMDCSPPGSSVHGTEDVQCTSVSPTLQEDFYPLRHQGSPKLLASSSHWPLLFILLHSYKLTYGFSRINSFLDPRLCSREVFSTLNIFSCTTSRNKDLRYTETFQTTSSISPWLLLFQINFVCMTFNLFAIAFAFFKCIYFNQFHYRKCNLRKLTLLSFKSSMIVVV